MGEQSASRLEGDRYQHLYSWYELLSLLDAESPYEYGHVEHPDAGAADDVTFHPRASAGLPARWVQVKWHVDQRALYSPDTFIRVDSGKRSLLKKLFDAWRKVLGKGDGEVWLVSNWPADPELGKHLAARDHRLSDELLLDSRGAAKKIRETWGNHLGVTAAELEAFCRSLRLMLGYSSISDMEVRVDDRMGRLGLRMGPAARAVAIELVRQWIEVGGQAKRITRESLIADIERHDLRARHEATPATRLYIHGWIRQAWDRKPDLELDWTGYFDRRTRRVATQQEWDSTLLPQLDDAKRQLAQMPDGNGKHIDVRGKLPLSALMAIGAEFPTVGSYRFRVEQPTGDDLSLWRSDAKPSSLRFRVVDERSTGEGEDGLLILSITGDAMSDVEEWLDGGMRPAFGAILHVQPDSGCGPAALGSEGDAVALAEDAKAQIRALRQRHRVRRVHLVPFAPAGFCLFLGQRLNALGELIVYERTGDGSYQTGIVLKSG